MIRRLSAAAIAAAAAAFAAPAQEANGSAPASRPAPLPVPSLAPLRGGSLVAARGDEVAIVSADGATLKSAKVAGFEKVCAVAASPDGARIAVAGGVAGRAGNVALLDAATLAVVRAMPDPPFGDLATAVAWHESGDRLVAGASDRLARILDGATLATRAELGGHTGPILSVAIRRDSVATGSLDRTIRLWDAGSGALQRSLTNHAGAVVALAFESDGGRLASAGDDRTVRIWDPARGRLLRILRESPGVPLSLAWPHNLPLVSGWTDGTARWIDPDDGKFTRSASLPTPAWLYALVPLTADTLATGTDRGFARLP